MKKKILTWFLPLAFVFGTAGAAYAQVDAGPTDAGVEEVDAGVEATAPMEPELPEGVPDPTEDTLGFMEEVYQAATQGKYMVLFGLVLILLVQLFKKAGAWVVGKFSQSAAAWLDTKLGKYVTSFGLSFLFAIGTAVLASNPISFGLLSTALATAWTASGGWEQFNDIFTFFKERKANS